MLKVIESKLQMESICKKARQEGGRIIFVPTMGNLHSGHLSLLEKAREIAEAEPHQKFTIIVSIFINPAQFGKNEDFNKYPRTFKDDVNLLHNQNITNYIYYPSVNDIYSEGYAGRLTFDIPLITKDRLCAKSRPHFFNGVMQVLFRFFMQIKPNIVIMGEKDYQQYLITKAMAEELFGYINVVSCSTERAESGLALSSRNMYLSEEEKTRASVIYKCLTFSQNLIKNTEGIILKSEIELLWQYLEQINLQCHKNVEQIQLFCKSFNDNKSNIKYMFYEVIQPLVCKILKINDFENEYFEMYNQNTLSHQGLTRSNAKFFIATRYKGVRLIDNL